MSIIIKRITSKDLNKFFDFFKRTTAAEFPEYSRKKLNFIILTGWNRKRYQNLLKQNNRFILAAWNKNKIVGILDAEQPFWGVCFCCWLMVAKQFQGKGIGTNLLEKLEKVASKKGVHMIYLFAYKRNVPYYKKIGYQFVGNMKKSWSGQDNYIFTKLLREPKEKNYSKRVRL